MVEIPDLTHQLQCFTYPSGKELVENIWKGESTVQKNLGDLTNIVLITLKADKFDW